jgi:hypothetical protein
LRNIDWKKHFSFREGEGRIVMKNGFFFRIVWAAFFFVALSSCAGEVGSELTLTFTPQGCNYEAPKKLDPAFTIDWVINDSTDQEYVYILLTLTEGKSKGDLEAWLKKSTEHPAWANILSYNISGIGRQTISKAHDLTSNASYDGSPVYIICSIGDQLFVEGPIKIKD